MRGLLTDGGVRTWWARVARQRRGLMGGRPEIIIYTVITSYLNCFQAIFVVGSRFDFKGLIQER